MSIVKRRRFVNPGKKRRLTAKQIKFFGTKRQRAALKNRGRKRRKNVSHIVVVRPKNPGRNASVRKAKKFLKTDIKKLGTMGH